MIGSGLEIENIMYPYVVADIGGTNARFALVTGAKGGPYTLSQKRTYKSGGFESFDILIATYLDSLEDVRPGAACIAVAGPVQKDIIRVTNLDWEISASRTRRNLNLKSFHLINDFAALAYALPRLAPEDYEHIYQGKTTSERATMAVIGAGTGFGVAGLSPVSHGWEIISSEGGHISFAATTEWEWQLAQRLRGPDGHVSVEQLLSGPGLLSLYQYIVKLNGRSSHCDNPADVSSAALANSDIDCVEAVEFFCKILARVAGDVALTMGAQGGLYIGGFIATQLEPFLHKNDFKQMFLSKGPMSHYVEQIPVRLIKSPDAALFGAAAWIDDHSLEE